MSWKDGISPHWRPAACLWRHLGRRQKNWTRMKSNEKRCTSDNKQLQAQYWSWRRHICGKEELPPNGTSGEITKRPFQYWALQILHYWLLINLFLSTFVEYKFELKIGFASSHKAKLHSDVHCCLLRMWLLSSLHSSATQLFKVDEPKWQKGFSLHNNYPPTFHRDISKPFMENERFSKIVHLAILSQWSWSNRNFIQRPALYKPQAKLLCCPRYLKGGKISNKFWLKLFSLSD